MNSKPRATRQREVILEALSKKKRPLSAVEICKIAQRKIPQINKTTVYRTLDRLVQEGTITLVTAKAEIAYYELTPSHEHHQHFVCDKCEEVFCVATTASIPLKDVKMPPGFVLREQELLFRGLCSHCS